MMYAPPLLSPAAGRRQRQELDRQRLNEDRKKHRAHLADLRAALRQARAERKAALEQAKVRCRTERLAVRQRVLALRQRVLAELREAIAGERWVAREACLERMSAAREISDRIARVRAELEAERKYQRDLRRIERANVQRTRAHHRTTAAEHRSQSDDAVRVNLPEDLIPLWERVKRSIRGNDRMSRTEAFLLWAEEHPKDVVAALDDRTDSLVRELEAREREAARAYREAPAQPEAFADDNDALDDDALGSGDDGPSSGSDVPF